MLKEKIEKALNDQINKELYSSYLYLSMCAYAQEKGMPGVANWMKIQAKEELTHANKFFDYVLERKGKVALRAIDAVPVEFGSVIDMFEQVREHEQLITDSINNLADIAVEISDHATRSLLLWFIDEQVEEEANAQDIIAKLKLIGDDKSALYLLDKDLSARVFVQPMIKAGA